jgi:hypothetical protein
VTVSFENLVCSCAHLPSARDDEYSSLNVASAPRREIKGNADARPCLPLAPGPRARPRRCCFSVDVRFKGKGSGVAAAGQQEQQQHRAWWQRFEDPRCRRVRLLWSRAKRERRHRGASALMAEPCPAKKRLGKARTSVSEVSRREALMGPEVARTGNVDSLHSHEQFSGSLKKRGVIEWSLLSLKIARSSRSSNAAE